MVVFKFLLFIVFVSIVLSAVAMVTYIVSSEERKKWEWYVAFSAVLLSIFAFFKYSNFDYNSLLFYWKQPYMITTYHSVVVLSIMAFIALPKTSIKKIKQNIIPIFSIFSIFGILLMIY